MSMMTCEECDRYIDTDYDVECFVLETCICGDCQFDMLTEGRIVERDDGTLAWAPEVLAELQEAKEST